MTLKEQILLRRYSDAPWFRLERREQPENFGREDQPLLVYSTGPTTPPHVRWHVVSQRIRPEMVEAGFGESSLSGNSSQSSWTSVSLLTRLSDARGLARRVQQMSVRKGMVVSTGRPITFLPDGSAAVEGLGWGVPVEDAAGSVVEALLDGVELVAGGGLST